MNFSQSLHIAIIMDGNGRWAQARHQPRLMGHQAGGRALAEIIRNLQDFPIHTLTLYCFSQDNWKRPDAEVQGLWDLFDRFLKRHGPEMLKRNLRFNVIGRRDRIQAKIVRKIRHWETQCRANSGPLIRLAMDYSAKWHLEDAGRLLTPEMDYRSAIEKSQNGIYPVESVDLLIRTGNESRLSDFLLYECAYAELFFLPMAWPDFSSVELAQVIDRYHQRERRFGALPLGQVAQS
ncbi:MAG: di-trans,poly-cis-decaprenylcistransferase [Acidobacteria bacterium]|nr:di-trans,poly-cis-decaprenylcistransferase [Acidobacteriota bacterium]MCB9399517.1 di-trans,poly-cis-decaprenylcistransferase [Acidobacteriota bacterium]